MILNSGQVGHPGRHGQVDFSVLMKIIEHNILILYSGQVGRPGRLGQVVFSDSLKKLKWVFLIKIVAKLDDQDDVDECLYQPQ